MLEPISPAITKRMAPTMIFPLCRFHIPLQPSFPVSRPLPRHDNTPDGRQLFHRRPGGAPMDRLPLPPDEFHRLASRVVDMTAQYLEQLRKLPSFPSTSGE